MTDHDYAIYSDLHKDARGFRPTNWTRIRDLNEADFNAAMGSLHAELVRALADDAESEAVAVRKLTDTVHDMVEEHGINRADALRWLADADDVRFDTQQDILYFLFLNNVHSIDACTVFENIIHGEM